MVPSVQEYVGLETPIELYLLESGKFRKFVHTIFPQAGFELGSLGRQASVLPIEPALLVVVSFTLSNKTSRIKLGAVCRISVGH